MQLWTFGLILLLILSSWMYLSTADEQDDDGDDDEYDENEDNPNCRILKEKVCRKNKKRNRECEETIYFNCKPTCRSYVRSTKTETSKQYITTTIYLCSTSTISSSRSIPISSTVAKISITPSFPMPSSIDYNSGSGSGDDQESDDDLISSSVSLSPSLSTVTSSPLSSALPITPSSSFGDRTVGENVFSSVVPSFTVQFPSSFPSTATATLSAESSVSSISPSPSLRTAAPSSSHRNDDDDDDKCDDDDNDGDDDGDDGNDDGDDDGNGDGDDDDDSGKSDDDATVDTSIITQEQDGTYDLEKVQNRKRESSSKQKSSCKTSSVIQSTKLPYSLIKTAQKHIISSTPSTIIATTNSSRPVQPNATSYSIAPSATSSNLSTINTSLIKTTQGHISSGTPSKIFTITNSSHPVRPNATSYSIAPSVTSSNLSAINTSVIKTTQGQISSGTPSKIFTITNSSHPVRPNATSYSISPSVTSSVSPAINTSTLIPKPDTNGTEISTKTIFPSSLISPSASFFSTSATRCHPGTNGTEMTTKMIFPSTSVPISGSYTLTASPTLPLSSSIMSESSRSIAPTPVLSSSSWEHSKMNSTVISSSLNATLNQSRTITPTMTTTVMVSSSILTQVPTVHCGEIKTGDKFEKGILTWQRTPVGSRANTSCPYNKTAIAYRWCRIANKTQYWEDVHDENCSVLEKQPIEELINEDITEENEERIAVLTDYITSTSNATVDLVKNGAEMLEKLVAGATNLSKIRKELLSSVSNVMNADPTVLAEANKEHNSTNKILTFIGKLLDDISLSGKKFIRENLTNLVAEAWDVANKTEDLIFENISQDKDEDNDSLVSVKMPRSLVQRYKEKQRITFINFLNDKLFPQDGDVTKKFINSKIVSVSVKGDKVRNLSDPIVIEFKITNSSYANNCSCVFWDFEADGGLGRWSSNGCVYEIIGDGRSRCSCSHLTHFGILVDLFPDEEIGDTDQLILEGITFVGCYLSIVGLVLTIITLLSFKQYRNGVSGQILLNLCLALLFSLVIFLGGIEQVDDEGTCVTVAALLHYFVLVAVLWMGVEAFHMFVNIVLDTLPDELGRTFVFKCAAVAWVVPMIIVVISVFINTDNYKNENYCRVKGNTFYIAFLVPTLAVMLFNVIIFLLVVKALLSTRVPGNRHKQGIVHFRRVLGIAVVFGITWLFGILAIGELKLIFQYLFCITNAFQGFIIFILYCLTDRKVRERLVRFLCALPDPNRNNRIIDSTSTQQQTDIDINLEMFEERTLSSRPRNWSGTWPMSGHSNLTRIIPEEAKDPVVLYPPPAGSSYNYPHMMGSSYNSRMVGSSYNKNMLESSFDSNLAGSRYLSHPVDPGYDLNPEWEYELDTFDQPYTHRNPPGSRPVTHVHLQGEASGDKLVDSTLSQLERSGGEASLQSVNSILFFDEGRRVEVPKYPELSGNNNNWERPRMGPLDDSRRREHSSEGPRRYTQGGDGLSFYKTPKKQRHSSATTSDELSKRIIYPKGKSLRDKLKGVHFSADELANSPKESERWSEMPAFPRLKTHSRPEDISETDEFDGEPGMRMSRVEHEPGMSMSRLEHESGMGMSRVKHAPRRTKSAQPSTHVIDYNLEQQYLRNCGEDLEHEEHVSSNFIAASESKNSRKMRTIVRPVKEVPVESEYDVSHSRQSSGSSGSETSPDTRWSEVGRKPELISYSQSFSDLDSDDAFGDADRTHFTQF